MVVVTGGMMGISSLLSNSATSQTTNEQLQLAAQYAQECAERVLAQRRNLGFDSFLSTDSPAPPATATTNTFTCGANPTNFTRTTNPVGLMYPGTTTSACPNLMTCRNVNITVTSTANAAITSSITLMLVYYQ